MTEFRAGDIVELRNKTGMNAPIGALATVCEPSPFDEHYILVAWHPGAHNQADGGYDMSRFVHHSRQNLMPDTREYLEAVTM